MTHHRIVNYIFPPPVTVKLTSIEVYKEDLALLEELVKAAETYEVISAFQQVKIPWLVETTHMLVYRVPVYIPTHLDIYTYVCYSIL